MSDYVKSTNFAVKDGLTTGDPAKKVKGTEIDVEFNAIASAISSKSDANSPTFTGTPVAPTASPGTNTTQIATTAFVTAATTTERTATATLTNKTISADDNTISGIAALSFILSNSSGNIDGSAPQKVIPSGAVVGTTDTQTLTNKTINASQLVDASITSAKLATAILPLGVSQTWQDVKSSRALGTTYTNSTGRSIFVSVGISNSVTNSLYVDSVLVDSSPSNTGLQAIVPAGSTYSVTASSTIAYWAELR